MCFFLQCKSTITYTSAQNWTFTYSSHPQLLFLAVRECLGAFSGFLLHILDYTAGRQPNVSAHVFSRIPSSSPMALSFFENCWLLRTLSLLRLEEEAVAVSGCSRHSQLWSKTTCYVTHHVPSQLCVSSSSLVCGLGKTEWNSAGLRQGYLLWGSNYELLFDLSAIWFIFYAFAVIFPRGRRDKQTESTCYAFSRWYMYV